VEIFLLSLEIGGVSFLLHQTIQLFPVGQLNLKYPAFIVCRPKFVKKP
jgi:hypothetical protein